MNLEEARNNIGEEVVLDESTKPFKNGCVTLEIKSNDFVKGVLLCIENHLIAKVDTLDGCHLFINIKHLKLKEQTMQNYKIKVTPETSEEVQKLFFELGYNWHYEGTEVIYKDKAYLFAETDGSIGFDNREGFFNSDKNQEITLPQLRDLVVLKRNDVGDATHGAHFSYDRFYITENCTKEYVNGKWVDKVSHAMTIPLSELKEPFIQVIGRGKTEMTWQDALRALADGKEVEFLYDGEWGVISDLFKNHKFRLAPQRKELNGKFTKEELLKIAGEME